MEGKIKNKLNIIHGTQPMEQLAVQSKLGMHEL
jgi:hypothetical protein